MKQNGQEVGKERREREKKWEGERNKHGMGERGAVKNR